MGIRKTDDHIREIEKLRTEIESMELEMRQLHESRQKLHLSQQKNEQLVSTLHEAKAQIDALRKEVDKLTAPPSTAGEPGAKACPRAKPQRLRWATNPGCSFSPGR
jgi:outer membrane murein-binding lipoprotein Lpp